MGTKSKKTLSKQVDIMSKKIYDHIKSTNYGDITNKIKKLQKKAKSRKVFKDNNMGVKV